MYKVMYHIGDSKKITSLKCENLGEVVVLLDMLRGDVYVDHVYYYDEPKYKREVK